MLTRLLFAFLVWSLVSTPWGSARADQALDERTGTSLSLSLETVPGDSWRLRSRVHSPSPLALTWKPAWETDGYLGSAVWKFQQSESLQALGKFSTLTMGLVVTVLQHYFVDLSSDLLIFDDDPVTFVETACSVDNRSDCQTLPSATSGVTFNFQTGARYGWGFAFDRSALSLSLSLGAGGTTFSVHRSVEYPDGECTNCHSEKVLSGGGLFVSPGVDLSYAYGVSRARAFTIGLRSSYDQYLTGNIRHAYRLALLVGCLFK